MIYLKWGMVGGSVGNVRLYSRDYSVVYGGLFRGYSIAQWGVGDCLLGNSKLFITKSEMFSLGWRIVQSGMVVCSVGNGRLFIRELWSVQWYMLNCSVENRWLVSRKWWIVQWRTIGFSVRNGRLFRGDSYVFR